MSSHQAVLSRPPPAPTASAAVASDADAAAFGSSAAPHPSTSWAPGQVPGGRSLARWSALAIVAVGVVGASLAWWAGTDAIGAALARLAPGWVTVAVVVELAALACLTQVQVATFRTTGGHLPRQEAAVVALGSFSLSQVLPAGGAAGGVFAARRLARHTDAATATTTAVLAAACSLGMLGAVVTIGGILAAAVGAGSPTVAVATGAATLVLVVALVVALRTLGDEGRRRRLMRWLARRTRRGEDIGDTWADGLERQAAVLRHPRRLVPVLAWAGLAWTLDVVVLVAIVEAIGLPVSIAGTVAAYGVANLANAIPLTPGGLGLVEAGLAGTFVALGADPGSAAAAALGYRLVGDMFPVAVTVPVVLLAGRSPSGTSLAGTGVPVAVDPTTA